MWVVATEKYLWQKKQVNTRISHPDTRRGEAFYIWLYAMSDRFVTIKLTCIEKAISTGNPIEAVIKMTDKKGEPFCATLKEDNIVWRI
jgi:hypothetical protein